jgi:TRAP-type mannitol/chloroaromatic compound transport system substrate-binding protein
MPTCSGCRSAAPARSRFGWYNKELTSADDLQGLRLRIPGIPGEMYADMGLSVITLPGGEIVPAGERGVIDAAEFVNPYHDEALGFEDVWSIHYAPAYHETVTVMEILFNNEVWDSMPEDLQKSSRPRRRRITSGGKPTR